jgi:hypothetical protein
MLLVAAALVVGCADCFSTSQFPVSTGLSQPRMAAFQNSRPLSARSYHARKQPGICSLAAQDVSVTLQRPLGIVFEEVEPGEAEGVVVAKVGHYQKLTAFGVDYSTPAASWSFF